jgi:3-dehydroquinate dehydratase-2
MIPKKSGTRYEIFPFFRSFFGKQLPVVSSYLCPMLVGILHGPNLQLLGVREPEIYGSKTLLDLEKEVKQYFPQHDFLFFQSNHEGELIDFLHDHRTNVQAWVVNPGGLAHSSVALADALRMMNGPAIEVHLSNVFQRESFRHTLITASSCIGCISGLGFAGYHFAIQMLEKKLHE